MKFFDIKSPSTPAIPVGEDGQPVEQFAPPRRRDGSIDTDQLAKNNPEIYRQSKLPQTRGLARTLQQQPPEARAFLGGRGQ